MEKKIVRKIASNAICSEGKSVSYREWQSGRLQNGELGTNHAGTKEESLIRTRNRIVRAHQEALNVADANPGQSTSLKIDGSETENDAARIAKGFVTLLHEGNQRIFRKRFKNGSGGASGIGSALAVTDAVNGGEESAVMTAMRDRQIARLDLLCGSKRSDTEVDKRYFSCCS
jgi:hypothetical protein